MRLILTLLALGAGAALAWAMLPWTEIRHWITTEQRAFQDVMARALHGIRAGEPLALWTLCLSTAAYGFVHAMGPGHGKILLGGAALASRASLLRLAVLTLLSSLAQAGTAILLVGGLAFAFRLGSDGLETLAERWLAPASYLAIAAIGGVLVWRGLRGLAVARGTAPDPCCGHAHGPSAQEAATLASTRDALALIASIAIRPCTGALFVLVIAARFDAFWAGALSVVTMGLGTAAFNLAVAGSGVAARRLARLGAGGGRAVPALSASLHITGGLLIAALSLALLLPYLS
ncbi:hypothetical protein K1T73_15650 [Roseovarius sp. SCSIO 43702]|nr:hypothetical protein K1T73_15650 [Roseovarius sp. SCSIO 43702]